jgi:FkbM family methyltransferase
MKESLKGIAARMGLLPILQRINYRMSFYNKSSSHPRKITYLFYRNFIAKGDLVFDIGSNIGDRVSIFREMGATTVAVEPQTTCVEEMQKRFGQYKNVHIENVGVGEKRDKMNFYICEEDSRLSTFSVDQMENSYFTDTTKWTKKAVIDILTMDDLIERYGIPQFVKIDVEGYEENVLSGLTRSVPSLSFEFSSRQPEKIGHCIGLLARIDSRYRFNVSFGETFAMHFPDWVDAAGVMEAIRVAGEKASGHAWGDIYAAIR